MPDIQSGSIFWFKSEGVGQEEQEEHPWIVISKPLLHRKGLVLAVPCTSVAMEYAFDVTIPESDIRRWPNVEHPLSEKRPIRVAKAAKIRHFSVDRVVVVGLITNQDLLRRIRAEVMTAMGV